MGYSAVGCLVTLTLSLLVAPLAATAQPRENLPRIGVLEPGSPQRPLPCLTAFQQGLRALGYVEGHNILLEYRYAEDKSDRLPALATDLVQRAPDVFWTFSLPAVRAATQATTTIPIVVGVGTELVEQGLVASLAQPGGNLTGFDLCLLELMGKQLELLKDAVPTISRVAVLANPAHPTHQGVPHHIAREARALGVQLQRVEVRGPEVFEAALATMAREGVDALIIPEHAPFALYRQQLLALTLQHRLPTMSGARFFAEEGSLLAYGADARDLCQRSAVLVDKILQGATPAALPVERADKFYLVVNLKTAAALGLTFPPTFLSQADEVIK